MNLNFTLGDYMQPTSFAYSLDGDDYVQIQANSTSIGFEEADNNGSIGENTSSLQNISMSFNLTSNLTADRVAVMLLKVGNGSETANITIFNDSNGQPGSLLATASLNSSLVNGSYSMINNSLNQSVTLLANQVYWIRVITTNSTSTSYYSWESNDNNEYLSGNSSHNSSVDLLFRIYNALQFTGTLPATIQGEHNIKLNATNSTSSITSSWTLFTTDSTAPAIESYNYTPQDEQALDPEQEIQFTFNLTDDDEISNVTISYFAQDPGNVTQLIVTQAGTQYNATMNSSSEGTHNITLMATDRSGNTLNFSITLEIAYEQAWTILPVELNTTLAYLITNISAANFTINNTGDFQLNLSVYKDEGSIPDTYLNGTALPTNITIPPNTAAEYELLITGSSYANEQEMILNFWNTNFNNGLGTPEDHGYSFTFASIASGPYLDLMITSYDPAVTQGQNRILLTAVIKNIGNESASNIFLQGTLPDGWSTTNGTEISNYYPTAGLGQVFTYRQYVNVGAQATLGNQTITFRVNSSEGVNATEAKVVTVSTPPSSNNNTVVVQASGGGGGGSGGIAIAPEESLSLSIKRKITILRGQNTTVTGTITNTGDGILKDIALTLDGYPPAHNKIMPVKIESIEPGQSRDFTIFLGAPLYLGSKVIKPTIKAKTARNKIAAETLEITITSLEDNSTRDCLQKGTALIEKIEQSGYPAGLLKEKLGFAKKNYESGDQDTAWQECSQAMLNAEKAISAIDRIQSLKNSPTTGSTQEMKTLLNLAEESLKSENYLLAERRLEQATLLDELKQKELQQALSTRLGWAKKNYAAIISLAIMTGIIATFFMASQKMKDISGKLAELNREEKIIGDKIKEAQEKYYESKDFPRRLYDKEIAYYRARMSSIEIKRNQLELRKLRIISNLNSEDLANRLKENEEKIKHLQRRYYLDKALDRQAYIKLRDGYEQAKIEIEREIEKKRRIDTVSEKPAA